ESARTFVREELSPCSGFRRLPGNPPRHRLGNAGRRGWLPAAPCGGPPRCESAPGGAGGAGGTGGTRGTVWPVATCRTLGTSITARARRSRSTVLSVRTGGARRTRRALRAGRTRGTGRARGAAATRSAITQLTAAVYLRRLQRAVAIVIQADLDQPAAAGGRHAHQLAQGRARAGARGTRRPGDAGR